MTTLGADATAAAVISEDNVSPDATETTAATETAPATELGLASAERRAVTTPAAFVPAERWLVGTSPKEQRVIDARLRHALLLQVIVVVVVLVYWAWGKGSWNHDPLASQRFRPAELNVLTNRAQNAALEFHHDLTTGQYGQARLLATESGEGLVEQAAASCSSSAPCRSGERVFTRATLMRTGGQDAEVFVESFTKDGQLVSDATYQVTRSTGQWLIERRTAP